MVPLLPVRLDLATKLLDEAFGPTAADPPVRRGLIRAVNLADENGSRAPSTTGLINSKNGQRTLHQLCRCAIVPQSGYVVGNVHYRFGQLVYVYVFGR
jgi:hypothetical protein